MRGAMADLSTTISDNASGPAQVTGDQGSVRQHPLKDQVAADKYLKDSAAAKSKSPLRFTKMIPPGTV